MSERDELSKDIDHVLYTDSFYGDMFRDGHNRGTLIIAILAAGYRKPRTIATAEELDALPFGSIVIDASQSSATKLDATYWVVAGFASHFRIDAIDLPATVLHEGAQP